MPIRQMAVAALGIGIAAAAPAQDAQNPVGAQQQRVRQVVVYGNDPCPPSTAEEIVVCARLPETERLRIPEELRETPPDPENESWARRAESLETLGETGIQSCSTVGPGGFTGCWDQMMRAYRNDQRGAGQNPQVP
jgi:hypothetical protein